MSNKLISVIIPAKDEPLLQQLVDDIHLNLNEIPHEIIVVDKSLVPPSVENARLLQQRSRGLGKAVREAIPHAAGELIIIMDGDYSHDPRDLHKLIEASPVYDIVLGSRFIPGGRNLDAESRNLVSKVFRGLARVILRLPVADSMSGFCAAHRAVFDAVMLNPIGYKVNMELIYKALKKGYRVTEVPITFYPRRAGRSKAGVREGLRTLYFIFALRVGLR